MQVPPPTLQKLLEQLYQCNHHFKNVVWQGILLCVGHELQTETHNFLEL